MNEEQRMSAWKEAERKSEKRWVIVTVIAMVAAFTHIGLSSYSIKKFQYDLCDGSKSREVQHWTEADFLDCREAARWLFSYEGKWYYFGKD